MKKWFLRLFVALMAFLLSVALTGAFRFFFGRSELALENVVAVETEPYTNSNEDRAQIAEIYSEYGAAQTRHDRAEARASAVNIPRAPSSGHIIAPENAAGPPASATIGCDIRCR